MNALEKKSQIVEFHIRLIRLFDAGVAHCLLVFIGSVFSTYIGFAPITSPIVSLFSIAALGFWVLFRFYFEHRIEIVLEKYDEILDDET